MKFRTVDVSVQLPDGFTETQAQALEQKLVSFVEAEGLTGTVSFMSFANFGTPPAPAPAPSPASK